MAAETNEDRRPMDDLEEGECSDSDDGALIGDNIPRSYAIDRPSSGTVAYSRSRIPQIVIHSDESGEEQNGSDDFDDDDDEDNGPSGGKRRRGHASMFSSGSYANETPFVNPLLANSHQSTITSGGSVPAVGKKRRNNIWGSVLTEQILSQDIKQFGVEKTNISDGYRGVESYDFTIAQDDDRPEIDVDDIVPEDKGEIFDEIVDLEKEVKKHESRKRKRNAKERLGRRSYNKNKPRNLGVHESNDASEVVRAITNALGESNIDLFTRIIEAIGNDKAIKLYYMTEDVEDAGGMMTANGCRRRTAGGVYIQLMKSEPGISKETLKSVFGDDEERWRQKQNKERKIRRAAKRRHDKERAETRKAQMDLDRPQTPTPTEEVEVLDNLDSNQDNDGEAVDFPERPATPEPKDDSSDGEEVEDDEDEDISVVIAKAKAAILRKQQQLEDASSLDQKQDEGLDTESSNVDQCSAMDASQPDFSNVLNFSEDIDVTEILDD